MYPLIYDEIFPQAFKGLWLKENLNCQSCEMATGESPLYKQSLKCCTYRPYLANYLVGGLLTTGSQRAVAVLREQIHKKEYATPAGIIAPEAYQLKFTYKQAHDYGQREDLLCPYFEADGCKVWEFRSSECLQFHCRSSHGQEGLEFWKSYGTLLYDVEVLLSQSAMLHKGYSWDEVEAVFSKVHIKGFDQQSEDRWFFTELEQQQIWQHKRSDIEGYYKECYEFVLTDLELKKDVSDLMNKQLELVNKCNKINGVHS